MLSYPKLLSSPEWLGTLLKDCLLEELVVEASDSVGI